MEILRFARFRFMLNEKRVLKKYSNHLCGRSDQSNVDIFTFDIVLDTAIARGPLEEEREAPSVESGKIANEQSIFSSDFPIIPDLLPLWLNEAS